jgi:hypothetical protein
MQGDQFVSKHRRSSAWQTSRMVHDASFDRQICQGCRHAVSSFVARAEARGVLVEPLVCWTGAAPIAVASQHVAAAPAAYPRARFGFSADKLCACHYS